MFKNIYKWFTKYLHIPTYAYVELFQLTTLGKSVLNLPRPYHTYPIKVFSIWCVRSQMHMPANTPLVWCVLKIARAISVYGTYCLGHRDEENERKNKNIKFNSWSFFLYFHVWLQNNEQFLVWSEYYNQFGIYQPFRVFLLEPR